MNDAQKDRGVVPNMFRRGLAPFLHHRGSVYCHPEDLLSQTRFFTYVRTTRHHRTGTPADHQRGCARSFTVCHMLPYMSLVCGGLGFQESHQIRYSLAVCQCRFMAGAQNTVFMGYICISTALDLGSKDCWFWRLSILVS